jgi:hypothetical protein
VVNDTNLPGRLRSLPFDGAGAADLNTCTASGWYVSQAGYTANAPAGTDWGQVLVISLNTPSNTWQVFHEYSSNRVFQRYSDGTWHAWVQTFPIDDSNLPVRLKSFSADQPVDANTLVYNGWYHLNPGWPNGPPGATDWHLMVIRHTGEYVKQIAFDYYSDKIMQRVKGNPAGAFSAWTTVYPVPIDDTNLPYRLRGSLIQAPGNDANQAVESGFFWLDAGAANPPYAGGYFEMLVLNNGNYNVRQIAWPHDSVNRYERAKAAGAWGSWLRVYPVDDTGLPPRLKTGGSPYGTDLNQVGSGFHGFDSTSPNRPADVYGYVLTIGLGTGGNQRQFAYQYNNPYTAWTREAHDGVWYGWTEGNVISNRLAMHSSYVNDLNTVRSGWVSVAPGYANAPVADYGIVHTLGLDQNWARQWFYHYNSEQVWYRRCNGSPASWTAWKQIPNSNRVTIGGYTSGTLDANGTARINFGQTVSGVVSCQPQNQGTAKLNVVYTPYNIDTTGFYIYSWTFANAPDYNGPYNISWTALVDL